MNFSLSNLKLKRLAPSLSNLLSHKFGQSVIGFDWPNALIKIKKPLQWLLVALLARECALLSWQLVSLATPTPIERWQPTINAVTKLTRREDQLAQLLALELFGKTPQQRPTTKLKAGLASGDQFSVTTPKDDGSYSANQLNAFAKAPLTRLNLQLNGVLATSNRAKAIAIIANGGNQNTYGLDETISGTAAKLRQIFSDRVLIENNNRLETLMLAGETYGQPIGGTTTSNKKADRVDLKLLRRELLSDPTQITKHIVVQPVSRSGQLVGYQLIPGSKGPALLQQLGVQPADIAVTLNGISLNNPANAPQVFNALKQAKELVISVERRGRREDLRLNLNE